MSDYRKYLPPPLGNVNLKFNIPMELSPQSKWSSSPIINWTERQKNNNSEGHKFTGKQ